MSLLQVTAASQTWTSVSHNRVGTAQSVAMTLATTSATVVMGTLVSTVTLTLMNVCQVLVYMEGVC